MSLDGTNRGVGFLRLLLHLTHRPNLRCHSRCSLSCTSTLYVCISGNTIIFFCKDYNLGNAILQILVLHVHINIGALSNLTVVSRSGSHMTCMYMESFATMYTRYLTR